MKPLITIEQAIKLLNMSKRTIQGLVSSRTIPHYRIGGKVMYDADELIAWQHTYRVKTSKELNQEALRYCRTH